MKKYRGVSFLLFLAPFSLTHAADLGFALGHSADKTMTYRFSVQQPWSTRWFDSESGRLTGYWTVSYTYWDSQHATNSHSFSASPVLTYEFGAADANCVPFVEAGIGFTWFSRDKVENRDLGSKSNFEDRLGVGVRLYNRHVIGAQALHYSNAGFSSKNAGIESFNIYYRYLF